MGWSNLQEGLKMSSEVVILECDRTCPKCGNDNDKKISAARVLSDGGVFHFIGWVCDCCNIVMSGEFKGYNRHDILCAKGKPYVRKKATKEI